MTNFYFSFHYSFNGILEISDWFWRIIFFLVFWKLLYCFRGCLLLKKTKKIQSTYFYFSPYNIYNFHSSLQILIFFVLHSWFNGFVKSLI
jgi:hypothetical protein